jgi:pSer/pThr/pTyr-binding forkhead associated (FHA) protein
MTMRLRYTKKDGTQMEFEIGEKPITIGRSPEADVVILDEKASRIHCGIRLWDGDFYIKDLKSRNGTYVNGERIELAKLKANDRIQVGSVVFSFDQSGTAGTDVALQEMEKEMADGKGYSTILREIVNTMEDGSEMGAPTTAESDKPLRVTTRKKSAVE